ncbi:uncharacterized protein Dere_GG16448 [Drosophila erecta]|uniref:B-cell lymphoma 9 beta-catenin binding domain-containing protein n=1 Tax=Drosophila erecta TaxID=7220 RepID=B3P9T5_DROER|nr:uncharacterized protein Dere_GG16448 [Drosophila erecta]
MLSTTIPRSPAQAQPQPNSDASTSASGSNPGVGNGVSATNRSSPKTLKNEPFSTMSPDQIKVTPDEGTEKNGLSSSDNAATAGVAVGGGGNIASERPTMLRQNSSSSINSCLVASPQNCSEHSNSSNVSATLGLTQMIDCDEQSKKKKCCAKDEEEIGSNKAKGTAAGGGCGTGSTSSLTVKEEPTDVLASLVNMKKEERENHSPTMSPVGFGSIGNGQENSATPVKIERISSDSATEKKPSSLIMNNDDMGMEACNQLNPDFISESLNNPPISSISVSGVGPAAGIGLGVGAGNLLTANANGISSGSSNCLDYMQQQNHIFVFSTQLANKGAESVLSGQFQTIIAYHCTQPATKSFLEDFFMKNPLKINKLQRHNSLGMPWIGMGQVGPTPPNPVTKITQQQPHSKTVGVLKTQFNQNENSKRSTVSAPSNSFVDQSDPMGNETELMCWDGGAANTSRSGQNSRKHVDSISTSSESQAIKILEAAGVDLGQVTKGSDPCLTPENNIVSLQGVKVPDENLTPQQRQHREEQLAKLKKMNQFLFPENENSVGANIIPQIQKIPGDLMMGMSSGGSGSIINPTMRQLNMTGSAKSEILSGTSSGLSEDVMLQGDVISDMGAVMGCNISQKTSVQCGSGVGVATVTGTTVAGINVNMHCSSSGASNGNMMGSSTEMLASFGNTSCNVIGTAPDMSKEGLNQDGLTHSHQGGVAQMEWSKIQQQFYEDRLKGGKPRQVTGTVVPQQQTPSATIGNSSSSQMRTLQGPPPPYHSTQRSASVPIATQSPNPSSPNNLSLPSPRATGAVLGLPTNSPSIDGTGSLSGSATQPNTSAAQAGTITVLSANKNCFQADTSSPSNLNRSRNAGPSSVLTHNLNSNPSTPLSHLSPKELDSFGQSSAGDNIKSRRPSPQGHRSPVNSLIEANKDVRFAASSPGVIFNPHPHMQSNSSSALNAYKIGSTNIQMERQSSAQGGSVQFSRRSDNIPLNPNSGNQPPPSKMTQNFDPISSLAQMSQQLTSCVSSMGSPAGTGGMTMMGGPGPSDINIEHGMISGLDGSGIDAINQNNCHSMNVVMNSMGPRMLNPKMCVPGGPNGFNPNSPNGVLRENSIGSAGIPGCGSANSPNFQGIVPPGARMMGRMPVNFGSNFNPNIQVKASTPNTIQYMPVRAQNANSNNNNGANNVRMPPSLEFLQRYANPQMATVGNGSPVCPQSGIDGGSGMSGMMVGPGTGAMLMNSSGEQHQNKITNNPAANNSINFFQNCNQMSIMDEESGLAGHDVSMNIAQPSMIRPMRPHTMRPHAMGPRMQAVNRQNQFAQSSDGLDCVGDPSSFFNNATCNNAGPPLFASSQQSNLPKSQHLKNLPSGMCQNPSGLAAPQGQIQLQGQGQSQGQSLIGPTNNNLMSTAGSVGASNGVSGINFVGPSSTDLKYAQQYHSFQQQLYATNTRSQQQQQMHQQHQSNMITMPTNLSPNPAFFVNK